MNVAEALQKAVSSLQSGRWSDAETACRSVLRADPSQPDALHLLGIVALQQGEFGKAVELFEKAIERQPGNAALFSNLGEAHRGAGRNERAIAVFEQSIAIDPGRAEAYCGLGNVYSDMQKIDDAIASFERAIEINPNMLVAHYNKGNAHVERGEHDDAIAAYRKALALNPAFVDAGFNLGNSLVVKGELAAAVEVFEAILKKAPHFVKAWLNLGGALRKLGRLEAARQAYSRALELDASLADAHVNLGIIARLQDRWDAARSALTRALEIEPDNPVAHSEMAHVLLVHGETERSISSYRRAIELDPSHAPGYMGLSTALALAGRYPEANEATKTAISLQRVIERPFLGQHPVGRVVILKGIEDGYLTAGYGNQMTFFSGANNIDLHFDQTEFAQFNYFVDGLDSETTGPDFPPADVIFNAISDPDATPISLEIAKRLAEVVDVPVINRPERVATVQRHMNYEAFKGIDDVVFPKTLWREELKADEAALRQLLEDAQISLPVLVRRAGTHTGESLAKADSIDDILRFLDANPKGPYYLADYIEYADDKGYYTKNRVFVVDGEVFPSHLYTFDGWQVSQGTQVFPLMAANPWMMDNAKAFLTDAEAFLGARRYKALHSISDAIGLDYFGIDFSCLPDDRILVFEANPVMRLPPTTDDPFEIRKPCTEAVVRAVTRMLEKRIAQSKERRE